MKKISTFTVMIVLLAFFSVVLFNGYTQDDPPLPLYALPDDDTPVFNSGSIALSSDGRTLITANMLNNTMSIVLPREAQRAAEIPVGFDPRSVAFTRDDTSALVVNRGDGSLSIIDMAEGSLSDTFAIGVLPYAVVTDNNQTAYVSVQGEDVIVEIAIDSGEILSRIDVPSSPAGMALWGDFLYITHLWSGDLTLIYTPQMQVVRSVSTGADTTLSQSITINPQTGFAYLPQSRSYTSNTTPTFDSMVFPIVNVIDLSDFGLLRQSRITLDTADRPVNMPFGVAVDDARDRLFVANAGSNDVSVIDLNSDLRLAHISVDANPRSVRLSRDGSLVYVHNALDGTVTILEARDLTIEDVVLVSDLQVSIDVLIGAQLFYGATDGRMSQDQWISCANCHFDGQSDGRIWQDADTGPRNTPVLYGLIETAPYTWTGSWDELADTELKIRQLQVGEGLIMGPTNAPLGDPHEGLSLDLDTLVEYLATLPAPTAPLSTNVDQIARGGEVFTELECTACHTGPMLTDGQQHDVGTDGTFDTPTLNWLWLSAPYFHDGRATTLEDVFTLNGIHQQIGNISHEDLQALIAYLNSLPQ